MTRIGLLTKKTFDHTLKIMFCKKKLFSEIALGIFIKSYVLQLIYRSKQTTHQFTLILESYLAGPQTPGNANENIKRL